MNKKKFSPYHKLSQKGLSPLEQLQVRQIAKAKEQQLVKQSQDQVFKFMIVIPMMVLKENYWRKTPKKKFQEFFQSMIECYEDFGEGFEMEDVQKYLREEMDIEFEDLNK